MSMIKCKMYRIWQRYGIDEEAIIILDNKDEFLLPGLIDSHIHASQLPNAGMLFAKIF